MGLKIAKILFLSWLLGLIRISALACPVILPCIYSENPPIISKDNLRFNILVYMTLQWDQGHQILSSVWLVSIYPANVKNIWHTQMLVGKRICPVSLANLLFTILNPVLTLKMRS